VIGMCRNTVKSEACPISGGAGSVEVCAVESERSSRLATLTRIFGPHNLTLAEDVMQYAFYASCRGGVEIPR
jgi:hypothetical protein